MTFEIKFYQDNGGAPGTVVYSDVLQITGLYTDDDFAGYPSYYFVATLSNPVNLGSGWMSIQGISVSSPEDCWFLWQNSLVGDLNAIQNTTLLNDNLAFCFEPGGEAPVVPLAPWALILAAVLIGGAVVFRYQKMA
jgi:hypothetical protein